MSHTAQWRVRLDLSEDDDGTTKAHVVLDTGTTALSARGSAHCHPADMNVPEIGDELAAGRAMVDLAHQLLSAAERDMRAVQAPSESTHRPAARPV
ncbi:dsRBD fold-containing protein [Streptomyces sp. NPDC054783]